MKLLIFFIVLVLLICFLVYDNKTKQKIKLENPKLNTAQNVFKNNSIFKNITDINREPYYVYENKEKPLDKEEYEALKDKENDKILDFNVSYFNMFNRINNTTDNFNNSVNKINDLRLNDNLGFNTHLINKTIKDVYNSIVE